jgi:hypothetical protein
MTTTVHDPRPPPATAARPAGAAFTARRNSAGRALHTIVDGLQKLARRVSVENR